MKSIKFTKSAILALVVAMALSACGSNEQADQSIIEGDTSAPVVVLTDQNFTPESFMTAGWKKSKQYDTATVPESTEIWYGFFQQKDILDVSGGSFTGYADFLVAGNAVLLCEFDRTKCDALVSALK